MAGWEEESQKEQTDVAGWKDSDVQERKKAAREKETRKEGLRVLGPPVIPVL